MLQESGVIIGLDIYTPEGIFVGKADNLVFDVTNKHADSRIVNKPSPVVAEEGVILGIPYRWVSAVGDIIILKEFPGKVNRDGSLSEL